MKKFKKFCASLLAIATICFGASVPVSAGDNTVDNVSELSEQVNQLFKTEKFTEAEATLLEKELEQLNNRTTYYMASYDSYSSSYISSTTHYLAPIVKNGTSLSSGYVYLYLNTNVIPNDPTNSSRFKLGRLYSTSTFSGFSSTIVSATKKRINVGYNVQVTSAPATSELFTYKLGVASELGATSEAQLDNYTYSIDTFQGYEAEKCIYSIGDLNRDGLITDYDATILLCSLVNLTVPNPSRSADEQEYDRVAFELAGDCDGDGDVDTVDVQVLNQYLVGIVSTLPSTTS